MQPSKGAVALAKAGVWADAFGSALGLPEKRRAGVARER
jgi:hypothetical protein